MAGGSIQAFVNWTAVALAIAVIGLITTIVVIMERHPPSKSPTQKATVTLVFEILVRIVSFILIVIAIWSFFHIPAGCTAAKGPHVCPSYALQNPWILRGERSLAILAGLLIVAVLIFRLVLQGRLPDSIGKDGANWIPDATKALDESKTELVRLKDVTVRQDSQIEKIEEAVAQLLRDRT